jgi:pimeloyl-ACP methyl ester carboxylesterase
MNPFFFGSSPKQLFGIHHPPKTATAREVAILVCYPFGDEYMRTHKAMRQLTLQLAKGGFHLLRFDYYGTGDSAGESEEGTMAQWLEDVAVAADELKETAGVSRVSLVGLRLGATLAAKAAAGRNDVDDLVLWDPIVAGAAYIDELLLPPRYLRHLPQAPLAPDETAGSAGFPLTPALRAELTALDLTNVAVPGPRRVSLVVSHERDDYTRLKTRLEQRPAFTYQHVASPSPWIEPEQSGGAMVLPHEIIKAIVELFDRTAGRPAT